MRNMEHGEFYEDDEPLDEVVAAWNSGRDVVTAPPQRGVTKNLWPARKSPVVAGLRNAIAQVPVQQPI